MRTQQILKVALFIIAVTIINVNSHARSVFGFKQSEKNFFETLKKKRGGNGNRTLGIGVNYMFPAPGLSVKYGFTERIKIQASAMFRSYGVSGYSYKWRMFGAELHYCFNESELGKGSILPFVFVGGGRGGIKYDEAFGFPDDTFSWWSYNVGGGLEWFPPFLNNNLGFSWKLGYGSIGAGSGYGDISIRGVFMYGFGIHYFIK